MNSKESRALNRIKEFMSTNAHHWKQDIGYLENALEAFETLLRYSFIEAKKVKSPISKNELVIINLIGSYTPNEYEKIKQFTKKRNIKEVLNDFKKTNQHS